MVVLHVGLLVGSLVEVLVLGRAFYPWLGWPMLLGVICAQSLRWWCIRTLGPQWNTRIVVVPGARRVTNGPYRFLKHPNYLAVVIEGLCLPLVHTAWITASVFSLCNAFVLRCECAKRIARCRYSRRPPWSGSGSWTSLLSELVQWGCLPQTFAALAGTRSPSSSAAMGTAIRRAAKDSCQRRSRILPRSTSTRTAGRSAAFATSMPPDAIRCGRTFDPGPASESAEQSSSER